MTDTPPLEHFANQIDPNHECVGEECPYPPGMYVLVLADPDNDEPDKRAFVSNMYIHNVNSVELASAMVNFVDRAFQNNRHEHEPAMIAFSRGRDLLRHQTEVNQPPPEVSEEIADFTHESLAAWKDMIDG